MKRLGAIGLDQSADNSLGGVGFAPRLVIMVKEPSAGKVKTRLARQVGVVRATQFYRHASAAILARLARSAQWQTLLAVAPDAALASRCWPASIPRLAQGPGDLGARMQGIMQRSGSSPTVIIGTDLPSIQPFHIRDAFRVLGRHDAVFGRAIDGGYWLVGMRRPSRALNAFANVRWSSAHALADTLANLAGRRIGWVATLSDVDDREQLERAAAWAGRRVLPAEPAGRMAC